MTLLIIAVVLFVSILPISVVMINKFKVEVTTEKFKK